MSGQEIAALGIVTAAAVWLVVRSRRRGLDDQERGCAGCRNEIVLPEPSREAQGSGRTSQRSTKKDDVPIRRP